MSHASHSLNPTLSASVQSRIQALLSEHPVVLFMKGSKEQPRCGFSAKASDVLKQLAPDYLAVDVLSDEEIRHGIKLYGNWPTIPQLYIKGELVGGSDIMTQLFNTGELHKLLGAPQPDRSAPEISVSEQAAEAIRASMADAPGQMLHLRVDSRWQAHFQLAPIEGHEIKASAANLDIYMDVATAQATQGMRIDWTETLQGAGLSVHLPRAPRAVQKLSVGELAEQHQAGAAPLIIDVRPEHDRLRAPFPLPHRVLERDTVAELEAIAKATPLAFLCHFGNSSRQAAEHFRGLGFSDVYNIEGGIDAYAREIDSSVARY
jgi:monothiol glutaredoxin